MQAAPDGSPRVSRPPFKCRGALVDATVMHTRFRLAIGLSLAAGCSGPDRTAAALGTFERFQDALFAADAAAVRALVTEESAAVVDAMPWDRVAARRRLVAVEATDQQGCYHVAVRDPNSDNAAGTYVVTRENGRMVVDLLATADLCARTTDAIVGSQLEPRPLTPADFDAIHARELATPPGAEVR